MLEIAPWPSDVVVMAEFVPQTPGVDNRAKMMYDFLAMNQGFSTSPEPRAPKSVFVATAVLLFFFSLSAADSIGFVPYYIDGTSARQVALSDLPELGEEPVVEIPPVEVKPEVAIKPERISAPAIGLDLKIQNPETRDIEQLDTLLKNGPARYVDSALLGQKGNVLIFAHSSHLPVIHNQMYKAFNRVPELEKGDTITISGGGKDYLYSVTSVRRANATEDELISLAQTGNKLTLVTCDTLTSKASRWILEAELVGEL